MARNDVEQAIAHDLTMCEIGIAFTKGKLRKRYVTHRKACMAQIAEWNREDGLDNLSDDDLLSELLK